MSERDTRVEQTLSSRSYLASRWPPSRRDVVPREPDRASSRIHDPPMCGDHRIASWSYKPASGVTCLRRKLLLDAL
jgi:hypothetical protein